MAPPPRPPIICYDLQTSSNRRRSPSRSKHHAPSVAAFRNPKVTVVPLSISRPPSASGIANRHAYGQKIRQEAERRKVLKEREREQEKEQLATRAQLDKVEEEVESTKRVLENLARTIGQSHIAARYLQKKDEEVARLREKVDQFSRTRSKEVCRQVQQAKQLEKLQKIAEERAEERRLRDLSKFTNARQALSSTLNNSLSSSSSINTLTTGSMLNSGSSPTLSSSCSSTASTTDAQSAPAFSFYKPNPLDQETIEVTDVDFFRKIEDKTMIEVDELFTRLQSTLKDMHNYAI